MKTIVTRSINLNKLSILNNFSREFVNKVDPDMEEEIKELRRIDQLKAYPTSMYFLGTGLGSAGFAATLGGNQIKYIYFNSYNFSNSNLCI